MNTRFALPVAVAVAAHVMLLFGFRRAEVITPVPTVELVPPPKPPPLFDPPEPVDVCNLPAAAPKGSPDVEPMKPAEVTRPDNPHDIRIDVPPVVPTFAPTKVKFEGDVGLPEGSDDEKRRMFSSLHLDNPPNARVRMAPEYPYAEKSRGTPGEVLVEFVVDEGGRVLNPMVVRSTDRAFEEPTLRAVAKWRFEPGKRNGQVVRFRMAVPVVFRLEDF